MSGWQQDEPWARQNQGGDPAYGRQQYPPPQQQYPPQQAGYGQQMQPYQQPQFVPVPAAQQARQAPGGLTAAASFWYVLQCIAFGAGYFCKIPAKKALSDFGLAEMTGAEKVWYVLQCIAFGAGYFAKIPIAKALSEMSRYPA
jgi:hypothetical protein